MIRRLTADVRVLQKTAFVDPTLIAGSLPSFDASSPADWRLRPIVCSTSSTREERMCNANIEQSVHCDSNLPPIERDCGGCADGDLACI